MIDHDHVCDYVHVALKALMFLVGTKPKGNGSTRVKHETTARTEPDINKVLKMRNISF